MLKMKDMKRQLSIVLLAFISVSCGAFWTYRSLSELKNYQWHKSAPLTYNFSIEETQTSDVSFILRHVHGFPFPKVYVEVASSGPEFNSVDTIELNVIGDDREYLGEGAGDIWDLEHVIYPDMQLIPGEYEISVRHIMEREKLDLVMEVGIQVSKPKS